MPDDAPSQVDIQALVKDNREIVKLYNELVIRYNDLVDEVIKRLKQQAQ